MLDAQARYSVGMVDDSVIFLFENMNVSPHQTFRVRINYLNEPVVLARPMSQSDLPGNNQIA